MYLKKTTGYVLSAMEERSPRFNKNADIATLANRGLNYYQVIINQGACDRCMEHIHYHRLKSLCHLDPNWWGDMPMIMYSFLESVDLSGKTIIPFNTHGGSGFSDTINTIAKLQPNATVRKNGFTVSRDNVHSADKNVTSWLRKLDMIKEN